MFPLPRPFPRPLLPFPFPLLPPFPPLPGLSPAVPLPPPELPPGFAPPDPEAVAICAAMFEYCVLTLPARI